MDVPPRQYQLYGVPPLGSGQGKGFLGRRKLGADLLGVEEEVPEPARQSQHRVGTERIGRGRERAALRATATNKPCQERLPTH
ncbi:hypothetical protein ACFYTG_55315 [Streptomyces mirabilis]|uniref:hypothetical protein n=1 Tax=Streptomyces mirabilis TaxID=68239 RepID=UPI0036A62842